VFGRDLDRFTSLRVPGSMCCNVPDVEGAALSDLYRLTAGKITLWYDKDQPILKRPIFKVKKYI